MPIITISRQMCSLGDEIAESLSRKLGWELISRKTLFSYFPENTVSSYDLHMLAESAKYYLKQNKDGMTFGDILTGGLLGFSENNSAVMMGFGSQIIFANNKDSLHIRIIAPKNVRIARAKKKYHVSDEEAEKILDTADKKHKKFVSTIFGADLGDPSHYHLTLNTATLSVDECTSCIMALYKEHDLIRQMKIQLETTEMIDHTSDHPHFKNESEAEFAQILDMYQIDWKYEPKTFPIEWDAEGNVTMAFSPDFYLTKFDTYLELTTMNQKYVTQKNKKAKKVRELYPGTNIKIVYKKDFYSLIDRYNLSKGE